MYPDKFAFLIYEHKIRTRGVTSSQSQTSSISYILPSPEVQAIVSLEIYTVSSRCLGNVQLVKTEWKVRWRGLNYIISFAFLYMNRNIKLRNSKKYSICYIRCSKKCVCKDLEDKFYFWKNMFSVILSNCQCYKIQESVISVISVVQCSTNHTVT